MGEIRPQCFGSGKYSSFCILEISLLSTVSKVYTSLVNLKLQGYLENGNILVVPQNGVRKGQSCQSHVFTLASVVSNRKRKNVGTLSAFIDIYIFFGFC